MTVNKRKKNSRQRASHTHGWGAMKKHRGAGNRGGRGMAGTGKRSDSKKPSIWKNTRYFGKYGFASHAKRKTAINIVYIEEHLESLISQKLAKQGTQGITINLKDLGINKLLSQGKVTKKFVITCDTASASAIEAVKAAGGNVIVPKKGDLSNGYEGHPAKPA